ncbi:tetratricopeptide repeat protein [Sphingomonas sp. Leaf226]|uniref:tetratricopeptide repeat protein n=1 Tax=Sphingomonas sp. Leaf226 TaxID=1735691 RepID=UPI0012E2ACC6|nr:tetratricopeptide repeat protein [Sphingomonas sp. Leaf226]
MRGKDLPHPIFFSVASPDVIFAEQIFNRYARDLIFLYSRSGKNGTWIWDEIEKDELPFSKAFVIFWSKDYVKNTGTIRELNFAGRQLEHGLLKDFAIVRCDDTPIFEAEASTAGHDDLAPFQALRPFLKHVRADRPPSAEHAEAIIDHVVARIERQTTPLQPRPQQQRDLKDAARIDHFSYRPAIWVSGLNGYGRKTLISELMREIDPNAIAAFIDIDETSLPGQVIARLESKIFETPLESISTENNSTDIVVELIERAASSGRFVVFRQNRIYEESMELPEWLEIVFSKMNISRYPKLFVVSQLPADNHLLGRVGEKLASFRMPAMDTDSAEEFVWKLISALSSSPAQWGEQHVDSIVTKSGGTPELMIAIVKIAARMTDLAALSDLIGRETTQFSETMAALVGWAFNQLDGQLDEKHALLFMNDVSPVTLDDVEDFLDAKKPASEILARLVSLGLVEQTQDELYRLSPLLSRRLSALLTTRDLVDWHREAITRFIEVPFEIPDGEDGYLRVETRIRAELYAGKLEVSSDLRQYVSQAHYFQIGIRLYTARRYKDAFRLLKVAFENRAIFDLQASIEVARFYCLVAIRLHNQEKAITDSLTFLRSRHQGQSMASFLEGENLRTESRFDDALPYFSKAQEAAKRNKERYREERIIRPYLDSILKSRYPNLRKAKELADRSVQLNKTFFSLAMRARVYLRLWQQAVSDLQAEEAYRGVLTELERQPGAASFYAQARAEEYEVFGEFDPAIEWMKDALDISPRFDLRLRLWGLQLRSSDKAEIDQVILDIERVCADPASRSDTSSFALPIAERYAKALKAAGLLKQFKISQLGLPLSQAEVRRAFLKVNERLQGDWEVN